MPPRKLISEEGQQSPRMVLAAELVRLRTEARWSLRELADKVGWDHTHLHAMEQGKSLGGPELIEALDTVYGTTPLLMRLWEMAKQGAVFREKYVRYMELEAGAVVHRALCGELPSRCAPDRGVRADVALVDTAPAEPGSGAGGSSLRPA